MESPCVKICTINSNNFCTACKRTRNEISQWRDMTSEQRIHIMSLLEDRQIEQDE
jgi:predicted Fe-S protein YdhL (DUF1289 family)